MKHSRDFRSIIQTLCNNDKLLRYYRAEPDLYLETGASGIAIGMALMQSENNDRESMHPIAFASKTN